MTNAKQKVVEIKGKYNKAKVFTDVIESDAVKQIKAMCDFEPFKGLKIRIMPDVHTGVSCTIGTTMTIKDKIVPNMVGVDIGCGMEVAKIKEKEIDFIKLDNFIYSSVPAGMNSRKIPHPYSEKIDLASLRCYKSVKSALALKSVGTLGGGNHFIEVDEDDKGNKYLVVHSGSRHLGLEVAEYYQKQAYRYLCGNSDAQIKKVIKILKEEGRENEINHIVKLLNKKGTAIPREMAYCEGELFDDYVHDMKIVQEYATVNRQAIIDDIVKFMNFTVVDSFTTIHNYLDTENMILRKGAVSAKKGERLLIPINMKDGSLICVGKGRKEWNESAPHGAGRVMSRSQALKTLSMDEFREKMKGVYSTSVTETTLDESPMAYKTLDDIAGNITQTCKIVKRITPVYNFKAQEKKRR